MAEGVGNRDRRGGYPDGIAYHGDTHRRSPNRGKALRPRAHHTLVRRQGRPVHVLRVHPDEHVAACDGQKQQGHRKLSRRGFERLSKNHDRPQPVLSLACATYGSPPSRQEPRPVPCQLHSLSCRRRPVYPPIPNSAGKHRSCFVNQGCRIGNRKPALGPHGIHGVRVPPAAARCLRRVA